MGPFFDPRIRITISGTKVDPKRRGSFPCFVDYRPTTKTRNGLSRMFPFRGLGRRQIAQSDLYMYMFSIGESINTCSNIVIVRISALSVRL